MEPNETAATILVVDDNSENRSLARATLEDEGFRVVLAQNGEEGIRAFQEEAPACVLLDVRMPGTDGFEVCSRIRELPGGEDTPIVFLTALRDVDTFDRALGAGGDDFLAKPVRPAELVIRVQAALKLRRMSAELREHYELVRHQRDDLMRLQLQKERLTAFVVHDLKNPLNSMDLHAQLLLRDKGLSDRSQSSVRSIREGVRSLLRLILNLLDISKSDEGRLEPSRAEVELDALFADVVDVYQVAARSAKVTLGQTVGARALNADADLLRRVLENLVDNAIRHAPEQSDVHLSSIEAEGAVDIRIADGGTGIPVEMRERIFERFVQADAGDRVVSSRGLGLAFCKLAVEAHGGRIWVEDGAPGTTFCIRIPR